MRPVGFRIVCADDTIKVNDIEWFIVCTTLVLLSPTRAFLLANGRTILHSKYSYMVAKPFLCDVAKAFHRPYLSYVS